MIQQSDLTRPYGSTNININMDEVKICQESGTNWITEKQRN